MIILGLGSNVGDRLSNLRRAFTDIKKIPQVNVIAVSPIYHSNALLPENAPPEWDMPHLNMALGIETNHNPIELLDHLKKIEWSIGRKPEIRHWGPRIIDIDILAWQDLTMQTDRLTLPHTNLPERPFALWPLADITPFWRFPLPGENMGKTAATIVEKWGSRFTGQAPLNTRQINHRIDTPQLVGILNITPDSFSDGGKFLNIEQALQQFIQLSNAGAEIIDIGAESTHPKADPISPKEEWLRLAPLFAALNELKDKVYIFPKLSLDTRHAQTLAQALPYGITWLNDVTGLDHPDMQAIVKDSQIDCVIMHHLSIPERRDHGLSRHTNGIEQIYEWGKERIAALQKIGIAPERIIFDPGIGFGKMAEQSLSMLKHIAQFKSLETRILVGHSRKTFLSLLTAQPFAERDIETTALSLHLAMQNIDYLRVHQVEMCARSLRAWQSMVA